MKRWVLLTLLLYSLCLSIVVVPLFLAFSGDKGLLQFFFIWFFPVLLLVQGVLLLVPIAVIRERPVKRRNMVISVVVGAIPMAALALQVSLAASPSCFGEKIRSIIFYTVGQLSLFLPFSGSFGGVYFTGTLRVLTPMLSPPILPVGSYAGAYLKLSLPSQAISSPDSGKTVVLHLLHCWELLQV